MDQRKDDRKLCVACLRENEQNEAIHWCCDCMETLCDTCGRVHKKSRFTTSHKLVDLGEVKNTTSFLFTASSMCTTHPNMNIDCYCSKHDLLFCQNCLLNTHKDCSDISPIVSINSYPPNDSVNQEFSDLHQQADELSEKLNKITSKKQDNIKELKTQKKHIKQAIRQIRSDIEKQLSKLETDLITSLGVNYDSCVKQIEQELFELRQSKELIDVSENDVNLIRESASSTYIFVALKKFEEIKTKINNTLCDLQDKNESLKLTFTPNEALLKSIYSSLGWIDINVVSTDRPFTRTTTSTMRSISKQQERQTIGTSSRLSSARSQLRQFPRTITKIEDGAFNARKPAILTSYASFHVSKSLGEIVKVSRGCFLPERHLLLCDWKNRCLYKCKLYGSLTDRINLLYIPQDVDLFDTTRAVVCAGSRGIQIINMKNGECKPGRFIQPGGKCTTISCVDEQIFVRNGNCKISLIDIYGCSILKINTKYDPVFISADSVFGSIYWTSNNTDDVQCIAVERSQRVYKTNNLIGPSGLAVDGTGHVFVAGYDSGNIHYFSNKDSKSVVITSDINHPWDLAFDKESKRLMIINDDGSSVDIYTVHTE